MNEFSYIAVARLRMETDGDGVTTLVGGHGCPLQCRYCLNRQCHSQNLAGKISMETLFDRLRIDDLYF